MSGGPRSKPVRLIIDYGACADDPQSGPSSRNRRIERDDRCAAAIDAIGTLILQNLCVGHDLIAVLLHALEQRVVRIDVLIGLEGDFT